MLSLKQESVAQLKYDKAELLDLIKAKINKYENEVKTGCWWHMEFEKAQWIAIELKQLLEEIVAKFEDKQPTFGVDGALKTLKSLAKYKDKP